MRYTISILFIAPGKSNLVADALSRRPEVEEEIEKEVLPESDDEEWIAVSYQVEEQGGRISSMEFNQVISELVGGTKIDKKLKDRIQVTDVAKEKLKRKHHRSSYWNGLVYSIV